jgi:hypothetical protein
MVTTLLLTERVRSLLGMPNPVPGGNEYRNLALQVGVLSKNKIIKCGDVT